jgi:Protein of unknown function (DUF3105)
VRRAGLLGATLLVALIGTVGLIAFFQSRDDAQIEGGGGSKPGVEAPEATDATLQRGNVLLTFREPSDEAGLKALADDVAGPAEPELVDAGQAVVVERREEQGERIVAHAFKRRLAAQTPDDPALREFVEAWLGQGGLRP